MASTIKEIKNPWIRTLAEYGLITVSIWIMVIGIYFFKFPNHFAFGGVTGFSTVFSRLLHCSASTFTTAANYALLVLGFIFLGKSVGIRTVYATIVMSVSLQARIFLQQAKRTASGFACFALPDRMTFRTGKRVKRKRKCKASMTKWNKSCVQEKFLAILNEY